MTVPILAPQKNLWLSAHATRAGLLVDARDYYRAFYEAARRAKRSILIAGWQFDSGVPLVRGDDVPSDVSSPGDVKLLPLLNRLCAENPELYIDILAWDFSVIYALERELLQKIIFDWTTSPRLRFRFDSQCPIGGSHHQKFAVIDDELAFVGGTDLCEHRWDDREHAAKNPFRYNPDGTPYGPYHEVQAYFAGPAARRLVELFAARWKDSGGEPIEAHVPRDTPAPHLDGLPTHPSIPLLPGPVAFSRTRPPCDDGEPEIHEIKALLEDAIAAAERLVYIETQYMTARSLLRALVARLHDTSRPKLEIVIVLPVQPENMKEELAVGLAQAKLFEELKREAETTGHALGVYNVVSPSADGEAQYEYIHSKLLVTDDRFLTLGSANMTNRSMGLDSELNVAWEAESTASPLGRKLRRARVSLLAEHVGAKGVREVRPLVRAEGLVAHLDRVARAADGRLRFHDMTAHAKPAILDVIDESALEYLDPEEPKIEQEIDAQLGSGVRALLKGKLTRAWTSFVQSAERGE